MLIQLEGFCSRGPSSIAYTASSLVVAAFPSSHPKTRKTGGRGNDVMMRVRSWLFEARLQG